MIYEFWIKYITSNAFSVQPCLPSCRATAGTFLPKKVPKNSRLRPLLWKVVLLLLSSVPQSSDVEKEANFSLCLGWIERGATIVCTYFIYKFTTNHILHPKLTLFYRLPNSEKIKMT